VGNRMARAAPLKVFLAGRVAVEANGGVIDEPRFPGRQGRLVFAYLVTEEGRAVPRDDLADALWGEAPPATYDKALGVIASKLRVLLSGQGVDGARALTGAFGCYRLELPAGAWVDVIAAAHAIDDAERALAAGDLDGARAWAAPAEAILREPFMAGEDAGWVEEKRREYAELRARAVIVLADACIRSGETTRATRWAELAVALAPFRENGYRRLMEAHAAGGNRGEALRVYEHCRRLLADELGAYPSPETEVIYRDLLATPTAPAPHEPPPEKPPPATGHRRRRALVVGGALAVAAAAAAMTAFATRGGDASVQPESLVEIDETTGKVVGDFRVGRDPGQVAILGRWVFAPSQTDGTLYRVDRTTGTVTSSGRFSTGDSLARQNNEQLWVPSASQSVVRLVRAGSFDHEPVEDIPLSSSFPLGGDLPVVTKGGGSVWVAERGSPNVSRWRIRPSNQPRRVRTYPLESIDWTLGAAFGAGYAWFGLGDPANAVLRIDAETGQALRIPVGEWPTQPAYGFDSVWVPMFWDNTVWRLDPVTGTPQAIVQVGRRPWSLVVTRRGVWVTDHCDGTVKRIDPARNSVAETLHLGQHPQWIAGVGGSLWVGVTGKEYRNPMACGAQSTA
jgi:DNA-binding SARP family transcriptional activator